MLQGFYFIDKVFLLTIGIFILILILISALIMSAGWLPSLIFKGSLIFTIIKDIESKRYIILKIIGVILALFTIRTIIWSNIPKTEYELKTTTKVYETLTDEEKKLVTQFPNYTNINKMNDKMFFDKYQDKLIVLYSVKSPDCVKAIDCFNQLKKKYKNNIIFIQLEAFETIPIVANCYFKTAKWIPSIGYFKKDTPKGLVENMDEYFISKPINDENTDVIQSNIDFVLKGYKKEYKRII